MFLCNGTRNLRYGGSGLVAAVTSAQLGARTMLAGYVGSEDESSIRSELATANVDDSCLKVNPGASGTFLFPKALNPQTPWPMYRPADNSWAGPNSLPSAVIVLVFGIPDFDPIGLGWLSECSPDATIIWDRQGWLSKANDSHRVIALPFMQKIYLANQIEFDEEFVNGQGRDALLAEPPHGFDAAVIKQGAHGVEIVGGATEGALRTFVPAFTVESDFTIGSGDIFAGALASKLAVGVSLEAAVEWGCAASSVSIATGENLFRPDHAESTQRLVNARC